MAKFKAIYLSHFNGYVRTADRFVEGIVIVTSSGSVGGWLIWEGTYLWAALIGLAQLLKLLKPILPYLKDREELARTFLFYEELHLGYEKAWETLDEKGDDAVAQKQYFALKEQELKQLKRIKHLKVPDYQIIRKKADEDWNNYLNQHYQIQVP